MSKNNNNNLLILNNKQKWVTIYHAAILHYLKTLIRFSIRTNNSFYSKKLIPSVTSLLQIAIF